MSSRFATVIAPSGRQPTLTPGTVTPAILAKFEHACRNYINIKDVAVAKQVANIIGGLQDVHMLEWLTPEEESARVVKLTLKEFMKELCARFLETNWESKSRAELLKCRMREDDTFVKYHTRVVGLHSVLIGTDSQFDVGRLIHTLEAGVVNDLQNRIDNSKECKAAALVETMPEWIAAVKALDLDRLRHIVAIQGQLEIQRKAKMKRKAESETGGKFKKLNSRDARPTTAPLSNGASSSNTARCPAMTDDEKSVLRAHQGCFKCRRLYVDHVSRNCPTGFPAATNYVVITEAYCLAAKKGAAPAAASAAPIAVVMPPIEDIEDEDDSATEDNLSVSTRPLSSPRRHRTKHLYWGCLAEGPALTFVIKVQVLLDNGAHLALIDERLVKKLGLRRLLREPKPVSLAISDDSLPATTKLTEYVKLSLISPDQAWTSNSVRFIVARGLCAPIILGLPWLARNKIVVDHALRTVIDKRCNFNLLHPPEPVGPPKPKLKLREKLRATRSDLKAMMTELHKVCDAQRIDMEKNSLFEDVREVDPIAAIRDRIETLAHWEDLQKR
ncbi:hypothetical protein B0H15DRAFT_793476 [Mycena belliarum]|uniref:Uncharacterized protein n=1 Tax=Mycena belliarum TaxID=1033014 RepID=A0AAD6TN61_9AGAR|nr:hypothetical protein B0H15DRAFT_793476 [Mycena belliae]